MRIVFMGSPRFAAVILEELSNSYDVVGVYTQPDRVRKRGKELIPTPVKELALKLSIPVFEPRTLRDSDVVEQIRSLDPDIICVAAYGAILPKDVLDIPRYGCINVHASLLPRWRGAAPIERAILAGDENAGVCIMQMEEGLDTGDFCISRSIPIGELNSEGLTEELSHLGAAAAVSAISMIEAGGVKWTAQPEEGVTYADKIAKGELDLQPSLSVQDNLRRVRASSTSHPCRASIEGKDVTIIEAKDLGASDKAEGQGADQLLKSVAEGMISTQGKRLLLGCKDGVLEVSRLKPAGKNEMDARSFLAGAKLPDDAKWCEIG